ARAVADGDADIAIAAVRRRRIAGEIEPQFPERLGAQEIRAARQFFHVVPPKDKNLDPQEPNETLKNEFCARSAPYSLLTASPSHCAFFLLSLFASPARLRSEQTQFLASMTSA